MLSSQKSRIELSSLRFEDIDHMVEFSKQIGWDNIGTQLTPGKNEIHFDSFNLPGLMLGHYRVQQSIHNVFALPEGAVLFLICRIKLPLVWNGRELHPSIMGIARSGLEHEVVLQPGWDCYEFMVSEELIRQTELFPSDFFKKTEQFEKAFLPMVEPVTGQFLRELDILFQLDKTDNGKGMPTVDKAQFYDFIIHGLQQIVDAGLNAQDVQGLKSVRRPDLVSNAREFIADNLIEELSVSGLAESMKVSERVLNYSFRDTLGISPLQYIMGQKLHAARRLLKTSELSVTDICNKYGFNTPSRFSHQYHRLFGELPSQTRYPDNRTKK